MIVMSSHLIKVAIIGPKDSIDDVLEFKNEYQHLKMDPYWYESEKETTKILSSINHTYDVFLFTGPIPYYQAIESGVPIESPKVYIPFNGGGLYRSLFKLREMETDLSKVSIDTIKQNQIRDTYEELDLEQVPENVLEYDRALSSEEIIEFHERSYIEGETQAALTCLRSAYYSLLDKNIPCVRIFPPRSVIRDTLEKVSLIGENLKNIGNHIVVGLITLDNYKQLIQEKTQHDVQRLNLQIQQILIQFVEQIHGHFLPVNNEEYLFMTTRSLFEKVTGFFTQTPLIQKINSTFNINVSIGVGIGGTANLAGEHARLAVNKAREHGSNVCFVVYENKKLVGPIGDSSSKEYHLRSVDEKHLELSEKVGVSAALMERIIWAVQQAGNRFTASDLAHYLNVSPRSSRRLIKRLEEASLIEVVGQESLHSKGKPRRVFQITSDFKISI